MSREVLVAIRRLSSPLFMKRGWSGLDVALCLCVAVGAPSAFADFRAELDGSYAETDADSDPQEVILSAAVFLEPVVTSKGPLAEAEFLSKASSLRYTFRRNESDLQAFGGVVPITESTSANTHSLRARYVFPETGWIVSLQGDIPELQTPPNADGVEGFGDRSFGTTVSVGKYLNDTTSVEVFAGYFDQDNGTRQTFDCDQFFGALPGCDSAQLESEVEFEEFNVQGEFRRVGTFRSAVVSTTARLQYTTARTRLSSPGLEALDVNGEPIPVDGILGTSDSDRVDQWNLQFAGTYYPIPEVGVDADYSYNFGAGSDTHTLSVGAGWFVAPELELRASYGITFLENNNPIDGGNVQQWRITLRARI